MTDVYVVKSQGVIANRTDGGLSQLLQRGAVLPDNIDPVQLKMLLDTDQAEKGKLVGGLEAVLTGDLVDIVAGGAAGEPTVLATDVAAAGGPSAEEFAAGARADKAAAAAADKAATDKATADAKAAADKAAADAAATAKGKGATSTT